MKHPFRLLYFVGFIFSLQYGLVLYINSSFLGLIVGEKVVGLVFTIASLLAILFLLEMPRILNRFGNYKTAICAVLMNTAALVLLATGESGILLIISFLLYTITNYSLVLTLDIFIGDYTPVREVGRTRGLFLTIRNLAILSSPALAFWIVSKASYFGIYISASFLTFLSLLLLFPHLNNFKDPIYKRISVGETFKKIKSDSNLKKIYISEFLLCFFYSWMIIYTPIYLSQYVGLSWQNIGIIFTIMLIPFVLIDYPLGRISDRTGEKKILAIGFVIITFATFIIFFIKSQNVLVWALVLFTTRLGAAAIEVMNESYFFKIVEPAEAGLISVFRNMFPLAFVIAPLIATPVLLLVPSFQHLYLVLAFVMSLGFFMSLHLRDVK